jgi:dihydrofolate reductase
VIGRDGALPWRLPEDLAHFKRLTAGQAVVMGRRTWESLPARFRPLPGRRNLVLSRDEAWTAPGAEHVASLSVALELVEGQPVWVIGGGQLYRQALPLAERAEVTEIDLQVEGDTYAPAFDAGWSAVPQPWQVSAGGIRFRFVSYRRDRAPRLWTTDQNVTHVTQNRSGFK